MALEAAEIPPELAKSAGSSAQYHRERRRRRREARRFVCAGCRRDFCPTRKDARYCTGACRFKAYRRRLAARAAEAQRARDLAQREAERAREATRRAIDLAHALIG